jgi:hypothetical protein
VRLEHKWTDLEKEVTELKAQLKQERECVDEIANPNNHEQEDTWAEERAREQQKRRGECD